MVGPLLSDDQVALARSIYAHFLSSGNWPIVADIEHEEFRKRSTIDVDGALRTFPPGLGGYTIDQRFFLSARGVFAAIGEVDETRDFVCVVNLLVQRYDQIGPTATLSGQDLIASGWTPPRAARAYALIGSETRLWTGLTGTSGTQWTVTVNPEVRHFLDLRDMADYVERIRERDAPAQVPSQVFDQLAGVRYDVTGIVTSSTGAAENVEQLSGELRNLAERLDGETRDAINKAADDARSAAEHGRSAVQAVNLLQTKLAALGDTIREAGLDRLTLDIAELRRQLRDHVEHHG